MGKRLDVWVDGAHCDGLSAAAERISHLSGKRVSTAWICQLIKIRRAALFRGISISTSAPEPEHAEEVIREPPRDTTPPSGRKVSLLNYPQ